MSLTKSSKILNVGHILQLLHQNPNQLKPPLDPNKHLEETEEEEELPEEPGAPQEAFLEEAEEELPPEADQDLLEEMYQEGNLIP